MLFNVKEVLDKYEKKFEHCNKVMKYVLYPSKSDILIVCFSTLGKNIYERIRMFWDENETWQYNFLFIADNNGEKQEGLYYLGLADNFEIEKQTLEMIRYIQEKRKIKYTFSIGSSMGGYAAVYFAVKNLFNGAIAVVPQVNEDIILACGWQKWKDTIQEMGHLPDLCKVIEEKDNLPSLYFQYGDYPPDKKAIEVIKNSLISKDGFFVFDHFKEKKHTSDYMTKSLIMRIIKLFLLKEKNNEIGGIR